MTKPNQTFGVFFLKPNAKEWTHHCNYPNLDSAKREVAYLVDMLGVRAKVFVKL